MKPTLIDSDFVRAAGALGQPVAAVKAVAQIEAPNGGFDATGQPRILFEGHVFYRLTGGRYAASNPTICYPAWTSKFYATGPTPDARNALEHRRLAAAAALSRSAALMSASWGKFQILGENYATCGYASLQDFINAMYSGEGAQLDAFVEFVQHDRGGKGLKALSLAVATGNWTPFAEFYNGASQSVHGYDKRLKAAFAANS